MKSVLSRRESDELRQHEAAIQERIPALIEIGQHLMAIRKKRLYRATHDTFESYCSERWQIGKSRVYQLIGASEVVKNLKKSTTVDFLPENERQTRYLQGLKPKQQQSVWQKAVDTAPAGKVTAKHVEDTVHRHFLKPSVTAKKPEAQANRSQPDADVTVLECAGCGEVCPVCQGPRRLVELTTKAIQGAAYPEQEVLAAILERGIAGL